MEPSTSTSSSSQPDDYKTIYDLIFSRNNEGLLYNDYEKIENFSKNFDVNTRLVNCNNETLMHLAIRKKNEKLIKIFYKHGGDFFIKNNSNETPEDIAIELKLTEILKFIDDNEKITFENEESFVDANNIKDKLNVRAIKLKSDELNKIFSNHNDTSHCNDFPNLFAFKIINNSENERTLINKIRAIFNDVRPLFVYFNESERFHYKRKESNKFEDADEERSQDIRIILNQRQILLSLVRKFCKSNDSLMIRILKLRKSLNDSKFVETVLKLSDNLEMFKAVMYEPFTHQKSYFKHIEEIFSRDKGNLIDLAIDYIRIEFIYYLIDNYKFYLHNVPFNIKIFLVNHIVYNKVGNFQETLLELIEADYPFPTNFKNFNKKIQKVIDDREIFKSNDLEKIKEYLNENKLMRIGYNIKNKCALLVAIKNKNFDVYHHLLLIGFRTEQPKNLKEKINYLGRFEKNKIIDKHVQFAHSKNYLILLAGKFGTFAYYENKNQHYNQFDKILNILKELDTIERCKSLLKFCAEVEMLKVTLDFDSENVNRMNPYYKGASGVTLKNGLIFVAENDYRVKRTIIHELCHHAMDQFFENDFNPYYSYDDINREKFEGITKNILTFVNSQNGDDGLDGIIANIQKLYSDPSDHQNEMIVRAFEILVHFDGDKDKIKNLDECYALLFKYVDEHVINAISSEDFKIRAKVRGLNAYIGLLQNIKENQSKLELDKNTENDSKLAAIFKNTQTINLVVSNVPKLALINFKNYLYSTQKSLYDAKNIFIDSRQLKNEKKWNEFEKLKEAVSCVIVDISNDKKIINNSDKSKLIFVTSNSKLKETKEFLNDNSFQYSSNELNYNWKSLTKQSQDKLVEKVYFQEKVNFQDKEFKLSEIISENLIDENIIDDELFVDLCDSKNFEINTKSDDEFDFFFERKFIKQTETKRNINEIFADSHEEFLVKVEQHSKILISDIAGSGKSYILRKISNLLMSKCDSNNYYWVLFVDLRKFLQEFIKFKNKKSFLDYFHDHFGNNLKIYEKRIFEILYKSGKVKILLDGFDEISPKCKDIVIELIKLIELESNSKDQPSTTSEPKKLHNQLWITTRKHLEFDLQNELQISEFFSLKSLETYEEMTEFLIAYWKTKNLAHENNLEDLAKEVIVKFREIKFYIRNFIGRMQQLKILAEICLDNDEVEIESLVNFTMYDIYEKSIEHFIKNWRKIKICSDLIKEVDKGKSLNFFFTHQYYALLESLDEKKVTKIFSHSGRMWNFEEIQKGGLVTFYKKKAYFIHETYSEFFVANFIIQSLEKSLLYSGMLIELFCKIMFNRDLTTIQIFVDEKIKSLDLSEDIIKTFSEHFSTKLLGYNIFESTIRKNHENVLTFLLKIINKVDIDKKKLILSGGYYFGYPLFQSVAFSKQNIFKQLLRTTAEYLTDNELIELLQKKIYEHSIFHFLDRSNASCEMMRSLMLAIKNKFEKNHEIIDDDGDNILHNIAAKPNMLGHEKLWERCEFEFQSNVRKLNELLLKKNKNKINFFHELVCNKESSLEILKFNLTQIEIFCDMKSLLLCKGYSWNGLSIQMLLNETNSDNLDKFDYFWNYNLKYMSLDEMIEKSVNDYGNNILHHIARNSNMLVHEKLWERCKIEFQSYASKLNELLLKRNKNNNNFLHALVCNENSCFEILEFNLTQIEIFCDMKNLLLCKGYWTRLSIQMLLNSGDLNKFDYFWNYNLKYMSLEELIENSIDEDENNILHYIARTFNMLFHEKLWERCKIEFQSNSSKLNELLLKRNKNNNNFLHALVCNKKSSLEILEFNLTQIEIFCDAKGLLLCKGQWNSMPIQKLLNETNSDNLNKFDYFWNYNLKYMSLDEMIENSVNDYGNNILHYIAWNSNMLVHKKFWDQCKIKFQSNASKLNELLLKRNKYNINFLHELVCNKESSLEILEFNLTQISKFFNSTNQLFLSKGYNENTLLQYALIREQSFSVFNALWNYLKNSFSRDDFIKHINELNSEANNFFYNALEMDDDLVDKFKYIEFLINSLENDLKTSKLEMKIFLRPQINSRKKKNILTFTAENVLSIEIHCFLWKVYEKYFESDEILDMINELNTDGLNLLGIVITSNIKFNFKVVEFTWNKIKNYVSNTDEQKKYVERCVTLLDRFPNETWFEELLNSYEIDLSTYQHTKRIKKS